MRILSEKQTTFLNQERQLLNDLRFQLAKFHATEEDLDALAASVRQLDELFLLVIVGEFNSGKSAFINALLGKALLKEGVTPTTTQITILQYGEQVQRQPLDHNQSLLSLPADFLQEISIVDTPGTNAIIREHETLTSQFVPRADLILFITSADRPFTESERAFLEKLRDWGKKVVIVLNKIDILQNDDELDQIGKFITENSRHLLGITPEVFPVSARAALRAKLGEMDSWEMSRFALLETYIHDTLDESSRLRFKFLNPIGVSAHLVEKYHKITTARLELLETDLQMIADVESQLGLYQQDMQRDFGYRISDIETILLEIETRGDEYFEDIFRITNIFNLMNKDHIQQGFENRVVDDAPQRIDHKVNELIDWLVESDLRQWQAVTDHIRERRSAYKDRIVGDEGIGRFHYDRERLFDSLGRQAQRVIDTYDKRQESEKIAFDAQTAVAASAALEVGAVGLGTLVTLLATTAAADMTGILMASLVAALGLFIIPGRRRKAKAQMHARIADLRAQLVESLKGQFEREIEHSVEHIYESIAPYTRFVRSERSNLEEIKTGLAGIQRELERMKEQIDQVTSVGQLGYGG
jgi:small GTP-binding protein